MTRRGLRGHLVPWLLLLLLALGGALARAPAAAPAPAPWIFGVFPFFAPARMEAIYGPLAAHLGRELGRSVHFRSASSYERFTAELARGTFDVAFINAFDYLGTAVESGYLPVARPEPTMATWFLVRPDSTASSLADLRGQVVALPPRDAANAIIGLHVLRGAGLTPGQDVTVRHFDSHQSCLHHVVLGSAATCVTGRAPRRVMEAQYGLQFRLLHESPPAPPPVIVGHRRLPAAERARLAQALIQLRDTEEGRRLLAETGFPAFITTDGEEYQELRRYRQPREGR